VQPTTQCRSTILPREDLLAGDVLGLALLALFWIPLTLGLAWPWIAVLRERWIAQSTV